MKKTSIMPDTQFDYLLQITKKWVKERKKKARLTLIVFFKKLRYKYN